MFKAIKLYEEKLRNFSKTAIKIHTGVWGNIIKKLETETGHSFFVYRYLVENIQITQNYVIWENFVLVLI